MITKYQKFVVERVSRWEINFAHYNPRKISEDSKKRLKKNIKSEAGLIETIVVNRLTMNLVSGHQRLTILDELEGYPKKNYELDVAFVEMSEEQEKKQNVFMNAKSTQGEFDNDMLAELMAGYEATDFGISDMDAALMASTAEWGEEDQPFNDQYFDQLFTKKTGTKEQREENKQNVIEMKKQISEKAGQKVADNALSYCVLNFENYKQKQEFMQRFDLDPMNTFVDGSKFSAMIERIYD